MKRKFIFDVDGTLLNGNYSIQDDYFRRAFGESDAFVLNRDKFKLITEYEAKFDRYDVNLLSDYFTTKTGIYVSPSFVREWIDEGSNFGDVIIPDVYETLDYLKRHDKKIVALSNWFGKTQEDRLRKTHLLEFFDEVYGADRFMKPDKRAYQMACGYTPYEECIMIGDNYTKDVLGARNASIDALYYSPDNDFIYDKQKIKRIGEIKERF